MHPEKTCGGKEAILLIEDEIATRDILTEILQSEGYDVLLASDGVRGLEIYNQNSHQIALIISDLGLPKIDGEELLRRVRQLAPALPIIIISGFINQIKKDELMQAGAGDIVQKPFHSNEILTKIREILDRK